MQHVAHFALEFRDVYAAIHHFAILAYQDHCRQRQDAHLVGQPAIQSARLEDLRPGELVVLSNSSARSSGLLSRLTPMITRPSLAYLVLHFLELGQVDDGRLAPGGPVLNQHHLVLELGQVDRGQVDGRIDVRALETTALPTLSKRVMAPAAFLAVAESGKFAANLAVPLLRFLVLAGELLGHGQLQHGLGRVGALRMIVDKLFQVGEPGGLHLVELDSLWPDRGRIGPSDSGTRRKMPVLHRPDPWPAWRAVRPAGRRLRARCPIAPWRS